jgi:YkoY family integral membrane protein
MSFEVLNNLFQEIVQQPFSSLMVVVNLILIESLLSVDNAAVLATMVLDLPKDQRNKALKYGILGAYLFRGLCLFFAALLIQIWWFKPLGGIYLLFLTAQYFLSKEKEETHSVEEELIGKQESFLYKKTIGLFGEFWATVILVEMMDLAFSIDNVIAANAYSRNIILIWTGVFIGILAMRFVAQGFVHLMERYPFLNTSAYLVIGLLGFKLLLSIYAHIYPCASFSVFLEGSNACTHSLKHELVWGDVFTSVLSIALFVLPVFFSFLKGRKQH